MGSYERVTPITLKIDAKTSNKAGAYWQLAVSPDNTTAYAILCGDWYRISLDNGSSKKQFDLSENLVYGIAVNQTGEIISSNAFGTLAKVDPSTSKVNGLFKGHSKVAEILEVSSMNKILASSGHDLSIRLWNSETGEPTELLLGHQKPVESLAIDPQGKWIASNSAEGVFLWEKGKRSLWNVRTLLHNPLCITPTHKANILLIAGNAHPNHQHENSLAAFSAYEGPLSITSEPKIIQGNTKSPVSVSASRYDDLTAVGYGISSPIEGDFPEGSVAFFRGISPEPLKTLRFPTGPVMRVAMHPQEPLIAVALIQAKNAQTATTGTIEIWNYEQEEKIDEFSTPYPYITNLSFSLQGDLLLASSIAMGNGKLESEARVFRLPDKQPITVYQSKELDVLYATLAPDGERIYAAMGSFFDWKRPGQIVQYRLADNQVELRLNGHTGSVFCVAVSPDNLRVVSGGADGQVIVWNASGEKEKDWKVNESGQEAVTSVEFSHDCKELFASSLSLTSTAKGSIRTWDLDSGQLLDNQINDLGSVVQIAISSEDRTLVQQFLNQAMSDSYPVQEN